ncbi:MAG: hypothetical protein AB1427_08770 [Thermodesulfobacteriota bacterium]
MQTKDQISRYEINRNVKRVLVRHAVDLMALQFYCSGESVYLSGKLLKDPGEEFSPAQIEALVRELSSLPHVKNLQFDLSDWNLVYEPGFISASRKR